MKVRVPNGREIPTYANTAVIDTKKNELVLNFVLSEGDASAAIHTLVQKIVMHPSSAKNMCRAIGKAIEDYEIRHGLLDDKDN